MNTEVIQQAYVKRGQITSSDRIGITFLRLRINDQHKSRQLPCRVRFTLCAGRLLQGCFVLRNRTILGIIMHTGLSRSIGWKRWEFNLYWGNGLEILSKSKASASWNLLYPGKPSLVTAQSTYLNHEAAIISSAGKRGAGRGLTSVVK